MKTKHYYIKKEAEFMRKRLLGIFMSSFLMLSAGTTVVFADDSEQSSETDLRAVAIIEISDPETGEIQT